jgi:hypothetical protein
LHALSIMQCKYHIDYQFCLLRKNLGTFNHCLQPPPPTHTQFHEFGYYLQFCIHLHYSHLPLLFTVLYQHTQHTRSIAVYSFAKSHSVSKCSVTIYNPSNYLQIQFCVIIHKTGHHTQSYITYLRTFTPCLLQRQRTEFSLAG